MSAIPPHENTFSPAHAFGYQGGMIPGHPEGPLSQAALRILYVEDNDDVRETITLLLQAPHRDVLAASSAEEALSLLNEQRCHVLFTDINLPGMSGVQLARRVLDRDPRQWVVLCSGNVLSQEVKRWGEHVRILPKLFRLEELEALMDDIRREVDGRPGGCA